MQYENIDYIIAGIPPSRFGVGRLMAYLVDQNRNDFCIIYPNVRYPESDLRSLLKRVSYVEFFTQILRYLYSKIVGGLKFEMEIRSLKSKNIILIHPQTIGLKNVTKLIENNNVFIYLMDCSFFCVKSYNYREKTFDSCLLCLGGNYKFAKMYNCKPFPTRYRLNENIKFLEKLNDLSKKITFITQNPSQTKLIKKHYGDSIKVHEVGLFTNDFEYLSPHINAGKIKNVPSVDFVYHGVASEVKGLLYVLNIASKLKQYSFLIPASYKRCEKIVGHDILNMDIKNVKFMDISWESGLKEYIMNSKVVLCPSLWSASIEGALIKSFIFNGVVALVPTKYAFANDLPESIYCKLDVNCFDKTTKKLKELIENEIYRKNLQKNAKNWVELFLNDNQPLVKKLKYVVTKETHYA